MQLLLDANKARAGPTPDRMSLCKYECSQCSVQLLLDASRARVYPTLTIRSNNSAPVKSGGRFLNCCMWPVECIPALSDLTPFSRLISQKRWLPPH